MGGGGGGGGGGDLKGRQDSNGVYVSKFSKIKFLFSQPSPKLDVCKSQF